MKAKGSNVKRKAPRRAATKDFTEDIVSIGRNRVICLPNELISEARLGSRVTMTLRGRAIVIRPADAPNPREGRREAIIKALEEDGPPEPMDPDWEYMENDFDKKEWTW